MRNGLLIVVVVAWCFTGQQPAAGQATPVADDENAVSRQLSPESKETGGAPAAAQIVPGAHEQLDAALWVQSSAEFYAIARQTFSSATEKLDLALRDQTWTAANEQFAKGHYQDLPPAVIVNLDETVWSNSGYQARIILEFGQHDMDHFVAWCDEAKCAAVPGAKEFLNHAKRQGVSIAYITPRPESTRGGTLKNLARLDYPYDPQRDLLLMEGAWPNHDKRESIGEKHRILLIISDSMGDFMHDTAQPGAVRREMAARDAEKWGLKWFLIPNPMYGHWEYSIHHYDYNLDRQTRVQNKLRALDPEDSRQTQ